VKERLVICNEEDTDGRARDKRRGASSTCRLKDCVGSQVGWL